MSASRRVAVVGALGRMGEHVRAALRDEPSLRLGAALESPGHPGVGRDLGDGVVVKIEAGHRPLRARPRRLFLDADCFAARVEFDNPICFRVAYLIAEDGSPRARHCGPLKNRG